MIVVSFALAKNPFLKAVTLEISDFFSKGFPVRLMLGIIYFVDYVPTDVSEKKFFHYSQQFFFSQKIKPK